MEYMGFACEHGLLPGRITQKTGVHFSIPVEYYVSVQSLYFIPDTTAALLCTEMKTFLIPSITCTHSLYTS